MKCDCSDCGFRGMEACEHRKAMDEINVLRSDVKTLMGTIKEAKDRLRYYFESFDGSDFKDPHVQNVYDVLCRDDILVNAYQRLNEKGK